METLPARILSALRQSARTLAAAPPGDREEHRRRRAKLRESLADLSWNGDLVQALREHLFHVGTRLEKLLGEAVTGPTAALEIEELRGDLSWIPLVLPEGALDEVLTALAAELGSIHVTAEELAPEDGGRLLDAARAERDRIEEIRRERLRRRAERILAGDADLVGDLWPAWLAARDHGTPEIRARLEAEMKRRVEDLDLPEAADALARFAAEAEDHSLDVMASLPERTPEAAVEALRTEGRRLDRLRALLRRVQRAAAARKRDHPEAARELARWDRRLRRAGRRVRRESQEVGLQGRLVSIFGARFAAFFDGLILWLILAFLGILVVEAVIPSPIPPDNATPVEVARAARWATWHHVIIWADTSICLVFLLEFFGKLALVRGRLSWAARHFLVDLVPSIPFGLFTYHALNLLRAGRAVRLIRFVRAARPVIRFFRFFGFLQRGMDGLVRLHGSLLNRNIVLFEPARLEREPSPRAEITMRVRRLRALARKAWRRAARRMGAREKSACLRDFLSRFPPAERLLALPVEARIAGEAGDDALRAEDAIAALTGLDPGTVEAELGLADAERLARTLRRLDVPLLRLLPGLRPMIRAVRERGRGGGSDTAETALEEVAAAGKALGRSLERLLAKIHWVTDLSGVVTGPRFLDRLGTAMAQATARPAKRLLLFGLGFLVGKLFVEFLGLTALQGIADWLERVLGLPFIILGAGCLVVLVLGVWLRRIAGEATDFYARTAEAQYLNLLKSAKLDRLDDDLEMLWERSLRPEAIVRELSAEGPEALRERFEKGPGPGGVRMLEDRILQLYRDYLDGAMFHPSDTKLANQLLGNLSLENIRTERLRIPRKERRRLDALDLDRAHSAFRGPYLWFQSINHSVAQWTARLIVEYNRTAIPRAERASWPAERVREFEEWLDRKIRGERIEPRRDSSPEEFVTTDFTALHFLSAEERRDRAVADRFGERTLQAVRADRRAMIRTIFGTYPFHRLPRADRTVNPFLLYTRYLAGGRVLLLPFYLAGLLLRLLGWFIRRIRATLREVFHPTVIEKDERETWAGFDVAVRKINRMRKPQFMECVRLRATFDPEYLGLALLPESESGLEGRTYREDLERIGATRTEWDPLREIREERVSALHEFSELVEAAGGPERFVEKLRGAGETRPWREAYRAAAVAYLIDYQDVRTLHSLEVRAERLLREAVDRRGRVPGTGVCRRLLRLLVPARGLRDSFDRFLARYGPRDLSRRERRWAWRAVRADHGGLKRRIRLGTALDPGADPAGEALVILGRVARHPESWSDQLLALRTVQTLSVIDVRNYRTLVWDLGGYGEG